MPADTTTLADLLDAMDDRRGEDRVLEDLSALIGLARAVLGQHQMKPGMFPPECSACGFWDDEIEEFVPEIYPCPTVQAIAKALTGEDGTE